MAPYEQRQFLMDSDLTNAFTRESIRISMQILEVHAEHKRDGIPRFDELNRLHRDQAELITLFETDDELALRAYLFKKRLNTIY